MLRSLIVVLVFALTGCVASKKRNDVDGLLDYPITPITEPTVFEYRPFAGHKTIKMYVGSAVGRMKYTEEDIVKYRVSESKQLLRWRAWMMETTVNGKTIKSDIPLIELTATSDGQGNWKNENLSFPASLRAGRQVGYNQRKATMNLLRNITPVLSEFPIKTGDTIYSLDTDSLQGITLVDRTKPILGKLVGYTYINGEKLVAVEIRLPSTKGYITKDPSKSETLIEMKAFYLYDSLTMMPVYGEFLTDLVERKTGAKGKTLGVLGQH